MQLALDCVCSLASKGTIAARALRDMYLSLCTPPKASPAYSGWRVTSFVVACALTLALSGVTSHMLAGQERYEYDPTGRLIRYLDSTNQVTEYTYDAADNILTVIKGGSASAYVPSLTSVTPDFVRRGEIKVEDRFFA